MKRFTIYLIVINLCFSIDAMSQDFYLYGSISNKDASTFKTILSSLAKTSNSKENKISYEDFSLFKYKRKSTNADLLLDDQLNLWQSSYSLKRFSSSDVATIRTIKLNEIGKKKKIIVFNNNGQHLPPNYFNDLNKLTDFLSSSPDNLKKVAVICIFSKLKPSLNIRMPKENQLTSTKQIEGNSYSNDTISKVFAKVNDGGWILSNGTNSWALELPLIEGKNKIEIIAIDNFNDTSEIYKINNVEYKEPINKLPYINFVYPNKLQNVVPKCLNENNYSYNFKLTLEPSIKLAGITVVIENSNKIPVFQMPLDQFAEVSTRLVPRSDNIEFCFFIGYTALKMQDPCAIDKRENYYYYLKSTFNENINFPQKILIHFESFNQAPGSNSPCNCD